MARFLWIVPACVLVAAPAFAADDGIPEKKLAELKAATAFVKAEVNDEAQTGSGFLIRADGDTGFVATNHHVVASGRTAARKVELVFWSGTQKERIVPAEVVASDADQDLAILKVSTKGLPAPLDLTQTVRLRETMTVYTFGFP